MHNPILQKQDVTQTGKTDRYFEAVYWLKSGCGEVRKKTGLIIGSSGLGLKRFLEIVVSGESGAKKLDLKVGDEIF